MTRWLPAVLLMALFPCPGFAQAPDAAGDSLAAGVPDTLVAAVDSVAAVSDSLAEAAAPAIVTASQADSMGSGPVPRQQASGGPPAPEPPLYIAADNMTGTHGPEGDTVLLRGNVHITRGTTVITSDAGRYIRAQGMLFLDENVRIVDSTTTVTSDHVSYSELDDMLQLFGNVHIRDGEGSLRAPTGTYNRRTGRADLFGGVTGTQGGQTLTADRASYWRDSLVIQSRGNVRAVDEENKLELLAEAVDFNRSTHVAVATGEPVLNSKDEEGVITELRANMLRVNTETRLAEAIDSVRVRRDSMRAVGDYGRFDDEKQEGVLLGNPRVWDDQAVVTGDTLEIRAVERVINTVIVRSNAMMDYIGTREGSIGEETRLVGDRVDVFFTNQDIDSLVAIGNASNVYQSPAKEGQTNETNLARGDTITIFFEKRKVARARVEGSATGTYRMAVAEGDTLAAEREIIQYEASRIEFEVPESNIVLDGKSHLEYGDMILEARTVEFNVEDETLVARGKPQLMDRGDRVEGHLMTYDLNSRVGTIYQAQTTFERGLYHGQQIRKVGADELDVLRGDYSTCDLDSPHYHFSAKWMKIYLKDKLVAKPVVFYVKNVPLLALPFWVFPIKAGRHSGFLFPQFELGFSNRSGQFIRNAGYYWAPNDYMDLTFTGDYYRAEPSWVLRTESRYRLLYVLDGDFRASWARNERLQRDDWDFTANHQQTIDPTTRLVARGSFVSSRDYSGSNMYGNSLAQRLNRFLTSSVAISRSSNWASFNAVVDRRQDLDADASLQDPDGEGPLQGPPVGSVAGLPNLTQNEPSLSVSFPTRQVGGLPLLRNSVLERPLSTVYLGMGAQFLSLREQRGFVSGYSYFLREDGTLDSATTIAQRVSVRRALGSQFSVSDNRRVFGWLNLSPRLNGNVYVFDFDNLGNRVVPTGTWSTSMTTSATFYGTALPRWGPIEGIRHVIFPSVSFQYSPDFPHLTYRDTLGFTRNRFTGFGGIGVSGFKSASMSFRLDQRFQVKLRHGDDIQRLDNLVSWGIAGSYNFLYRERGQLHPLSNISSSIRIQPPRLIDATFSWITDVYNPRPVRSASLQLGTRLASSGWGAAQDPNLPVSESANRERQPSWYRDAWSLTGAFSSAGGYSGDRWTTQQTLNGIIHYQLSPAWTVDWSASYDITRRSMQTQRFVLSRDLHCWTATFTRTFIVGGETEYYFRIGIKEQREVYLERGTRAGSIGGLN